MKVKKAIIPVAGKGTRFLPATKEVPKELLPILTKPMIQFVVEEAVQAGIEEIIFVTSSGKESIENYFDRNIELETFLKAAGKDQLLQTIENVSRLVKINTVRQKEQLGLGHAVLMAQAFINEGESFAVLLGDDIIDSQTPVTKQLIDIASTHNQSSVIGVMNVAKQDTSKYGIVSGTRINDKTLKMSEMVEKPQPEFAPSTLATPGRYILNSSIFDCLKNISRGAGGEYQLTDAINMLAKNSDVFAYEFDGKRYDTGSITGYLEATIDFALKDKGLRPFVLNLIKDKLRSEE